MYALEFDKPILNAASSLGFYPDTHNSIDVSILGAFVTNPISIQPRKAANGVRQIEYPGGVLLHTGFPNPGMTRALKQFAAQWQRASLPIIVHLLADSPKAARSMTEKLEALGTIYALVVGLRPDVNIKDAAEIIQASLGELPVIAQVPLQRAIELSQVVVSAGATAVSLAPARGTLPDTNGNLVSGRMYGPALFPQALAIVETLSSLDIPIIGAGGIYQQAQADTMLAAGALAVQLDTVLWRGEWGED